MILKRRKYNLPKFPPQSAPTFKALCKVVPISDLPDLTQALDRAVDAMKQEAAGNNLMSVERIEQMHERCRYLLSEYENLSEREQSLVMGIIFYFAIDDDPFPDSSFATGMDDDIQIMNYVLEELGLTDKYIE